MSDDDVVAASGGGIARLAHHSFLFLFFFALKTGCTNQRKIKEKFRRPTPSLSLDLSTLSVASSGVFPPQNTDNAKS